MTTAEPVPGNYLAIDAGMSGLPALYILSEIFGRLGYDLEVEEELRPCEYFDMIIGSGTGGKVPPYALNAGSQQLQDSKAMTWEEAMGKQLVLNDQKLRNALKEIIISADQNPDSLFMERNGNTKRCKTAICALNEANVSRCQLVRSYRTRGMSPPKCTILDAANISIASARSYSPVTLGTEHNKVALTEALVGCANPIKELLREAKVQFGESARVATVLSLGSGKADILKTSQANPSLFQAIRQMTLDTERTHEDIAQQLQEAYIYFRLNVEHGLGFVIESGAIEAHVQAYLGENSTSQAIDGLINSIQQRKPGPSLKELTSVTTMPSLLKPRPSLVPYFIGRDVFLDALISTHFSNPLAHHSAFISVLVGLGGSGKTQLALRFALEYESRFPTGVVYFVDARSKGRLEADLEAIIRSRGVAYRAQTYQDTLAWLAERDNWFMILDNADDPNLKLFPYIPKSNGGHVIITTRNSTNSVLAPNSSHLVGDLSEEEAISLILTAAAHEQNPSNRKLAQQIASELGCLPLACSHAAGYILVHRCLGSYLDLYRQRRHYLLSNTSLDLPQDYKESVAATIEMSLERLPRNVRELLRLLSLFQPSSISYSMIETAARRRFAYDAFTFQGIDSSQFEHANALMALLCPSGEWSEFDFNALIQACLQYSLLQLTITEDNAKFYSMHILVQSWLQLGIPPDDPLRSLNVRLLASCVTSDEYYRHISLHRSLIPHIISASIDKIVSVCDLVAFAWVMEESRHGDRAALYLNKALGICISTFGEAHLDTIAVMGRLAGSFESWGHFEDGFALRKRVLEARKALLGEEHAHTVLAMGNLARSCASLGKHQEAINLDSQVLEIRLRTLGTDHRDTLLSMANLAVSLKAIEQYDTAEALESEALRLRRKYFPNDKAAILVVMDNLGHTLNELGHHDEALALQREAVELWKAVAGPQHVETLVSMTNLAHTLDTLGQDEEAMSLRKTAFEALRLTQGSNHPVTLLAETNYALSLCALGQVEKAVEVQQDIVQFTDFIVHCSYPTLHQALSNLEESFTKMGRRREAAQLRACSPGEV
ncbi:SubName: Full=Uncharacterized protein {ECO:0000313/EMBL:CCA66819.1} [Serendipita indica DSM 11827]|nr:SubName: Full=Uncharacterized protein {ECO:0000313/EMBL:CCA66819.1} [Serendipita indica DSM 11827]